MNFQQLDTGDFRIYAVAFDSAQGGYVAGVEVRRLRQGSDTRQVVFSDEFLSGGHRFDVPADALHYALMVGQRAAGVRTSQGPGPSA